MQEIPRPSRSFVVSSLIIIVFHILTAAMLISAFIALTEGRQLVSPLMGAGFGPLLSVVSFAVAFTQYAATFLRKQSFAQLLGLLLLIVGIPCLLPIILAPATFFLKSESAEAAGELWKMWPLLVIPMIISIVHFLAAAQNWAWSKELSMFQANELVSVSNAARRGLTALIIAVPALITTFYLLNMEGGKPVIAMHATTGEANAAFDLHLPENATDVILYHRLSNTLCDFAIDEEGFKAWVTTLFDTLDIKADKRKFEAITDKDSYWTYRYDLTRPEHIFFGFTINNGLKFEHVFRNQGGYRFSYDRDTKRAYYVFSSR